VDLGRPARGRDVTRTQRQIEEIRQGDWCVQVRDPAGLPRAGVPVWVEQETHAFTFGCVAPDLGGASESDRQRCAARLKEVFNRVVPADRPPDSGAIFVCVPDGIHLGRFRQHLDWVAAAGRPLEVYVRGGSVGLSPEVDDSRERVAAERVASLYALCFAHRAVRAIVWNGFWDGEARAVGGGLLRTDFAPRPAFRFLHKLIGNVWHSRASGVTDPDGRFEFRGFFGDYRVATRAGDEAATTAVVSCRDNGGALILLPVPAEPGRGG
jgi:hypothetical protein